jgi:hypothetical protein
LAPLSLGYGHPEGDAAVKTVFRLNQLPPSTNNLFLDQGRFRRRNIWISAPAAKEDHGSTSQWNEPEVRFGVKAPLDFS